MIFNKKKTKNNYRQGVFIVIYKKEYNKTLYLILKRKLHWAGWEFPKGGQENGETKLQTAKRETKEESNLQIKKLVSYKISGKYKYHKEFPDRKGFTGQTFSLFSAEVTNGKVKIDKREHTAFKWLEYKNAHKILTWPNQKKCLEIVNKKLSN